MVGNGFDGFPGKLKRESIMAADMGMVVAAAEPEQKQ